MNVLESVKELLINQLSVIPVTKDKRPKVKWTEYQKRIMTEEEAESVFSDLDNVAIICGEVSSGLECIDIDQKYSLDGMLMNDLSVAIMNKDEELYNKLVIQETVNGGYHLIYRCTKVEGNQKLAMRDTTDEEKNGNEKDTERVLIETRGTNGYFLAEPSEGYKVIQGNLTAIPKITQKERATLIAICETFNSKSKQQFTQRVESTSKTREISPLDDYDNRGDGVGVLLNAGWTIIKDNNDKTILRRPGGTSPSSGYYHKTGKYANRFTFFSSACGFEVQKVYKPHAVYTEIEHNGNYTSAARQLARDGFGSDEVKFQAKEKIVKSTQKKDLNPLNYTSSKKEILEYLNHSREDSFIMGNSTGIPSLDEYFRHKRKSLVIINGHSNTGKTTVIWYLLFLVAKNDGWRMVIHADENEAGECYESLMEFYVGKRLKEMNDEEYDESFNFVEDHFRILSNKLTYTYQDLMAISEQIHKEWEFDILLIDPFNGLDSDINNKYAHNYQALNHLRKLCTNLNISVYINTHSVTKSARALDGERKNIAPEMAETEGGMSFASKANDFITIHRDIYAEYPENMVNEIHIRKIKNKKTGGQPTPRANPVLIQMKDDFTGFVDKHQFNPVTQKHEISQEEVQEQLKLAEKDDYWDYNPK